MASQPEVDKSKPQLPFGGYLFTPPENTVDSFSQQDDESAARHSIGQWHTAAQPTRLPPIVHTPPASPNESVLPSLTSATGYGIHDAPLFPQQAPSTEREQSQQPLFERARSQSPAPTQTSQRSLSIHTLDCGPPNRKPHSQVFPHNLGITTHEQAWGYFQDRLQELRDMKALPTPRTSPSWHLHKEDERQLHSLTRSAGVSKSKPATRIASKPKAPVTASPAKPSPPKRRTPKARVMSDFSDSAFPHKEPTTKHKRAPPSKKIEGEHVNWTDIPDYAPPASELDTNAKSLKVAWHGHALPLADDPDTIHLHDQELQVASVLRLSCATYLANKRKIFQARLQSIKDGKNFTKTAAQSACKIDVNKASQLWEAFDRVGWFHQDWYTRFL